MPTSPFEPILDHLPALRRYARLLAGDSARADDLVQDCVERACLKWTLWRPGTSLRPWLFTIMHNVHANLRRDFRHDDQRLDLEGVPEPSEDPTVARGVGMDMQRALAQLSLPHRQVLLLVTVEEYTYAEVAQMLDVPIGTVMSRLHRAREQMRMLVDPEGQRSQPLHLIKR